MNNNYNHKILEAKWQDIWSKTQAQKGQNHSTHTKAQKDKYYVLEMFPYPSGRIHMGHVRNYVIGDTIVRHKIKQGYHAIHPMGWDSFGLPAENAARQNNMHPRVWTENNIQHMKKELQNLGLNIDWHRELATHTPEYYTQQQKLFILLWKNDLAIRKNSWINWDPVDQTVLANEQVINGRGWRSGAVVQRRMLSQWFFKITDFAEELLRDLDKLQQWPETVINMQRNWIGKSTGMVINFPVIDQKEVIQVYSTRPETLFGATYVSIAPEHALVKQWQQDPAIQAYINTYTTSAQNQHNQPITGIFTGHYVLHPLTKEHLPVFINNKISADYSTGAVFNCPAHNQLDFDFAKMFNLPSKTVIHTSGDITSDKAYTDTDGHMINSDFLNDLEVLQARAAMSEYLQKNNLGVPKTNYRLRDWGISRQRSWGCPIPMIYCPSCQYVANEEPVLIPRIEHWQTAEIKTVLQQWQQINCPQCQQPAKRETDTMDTFVDSAWYFLRFCSSQAQEPIDIKQIKACMPVDYYIGGIEHAILHLLYARFFCKALRKCNIDVPAEPFHRLFTQGMIRHPTYKNQDNKWLYPQEVDLSDGQNPTEKATGKPVIIGKSEAMSKSKCNVVTPDLIIKQYGSDSLRWFILSDNPPERDIDWNDLKMQTKAKYLTKVWKLCLNLLDKINSDAAQEKTSLPNVKHGHSHQFYVKVQKILAQSLDYLEKLQFNNYIAQIYILTDLMQKFTLQEPEDAAVMNLAIQILCHLLSPITPHLAAEIWQRGKFGHDNQDDVTSLKWPAIDTVAIAENTHNIAIEINNRVKLILMVKSNQNKEEIIAQAKQALQKNNPQLDLTNTKKIIYVPNRIINFIL